jgi:gluconolactonase
VFPMFAPPEDMSNRPRFHTVDNSFQQILGDEPEVTLCREHDAYPWAREAGVFLPATMDLYVSSGSISVGTGSGPGPAGDRTAVITRVGMAAEPFTYEELPPDRVPMAAGGTRFQSGVLFCSQGTPERPGGLVLMQPKPPYYAVPVVQSFHGRAFNSPSDAALHADGSVWFADPVRGFDRGFRPAPELPSQVYRYDPRTKYVRAVADGFGRPCGLAFSPDQRTLYVTDTDCARGDGEPDLSRVSSM